MRNKRGGTFADLIVALTLAVLLIPTAVSVVTTSRETSNRIQCASNLKQIGQAILLYSNENRNAYPRTRYDPATADKPNFWTGADATKPFADDGPAENDVTAAYRLLLLTQDLVPEVFTCPKSPLEYDRDFANGRAERKVANFADERELGYSFANPYPTAAVRDAVVGGRPAGYRLNNSISAEFAVAADINPGVNPPASDVLAVTPTDSARQQRLANSPNHDKDGQNVLYGDGHVEFQQSAFVGVGRDNIYTFGTPPAHGVVGPPADANDSVLLPTLDPQRWKNVTRRAPRQELPVMAIAIGLVMITVIVGLIALTRRPSPPASPAA